MGKLANGDTLIIKSGEYLMDVGVGCSGGTEESGRKTIKSETGSPADVVLYGCGTNELFRFAKFVTLSGVTLSNGVNSTSQPAGAVRFGTDNYPDYATIVSNCVVTCCTNTFTTSRNGAAVALFGHNLLVDCVIKGNTSTSGNGAGVIIVNNDTIVGVPKMKRCRIEGNVSAGGGGGVYVANNTLNSTKESNGNVVEIEDCEIVDNTSAASGGGVYCATNLTLNISRCVIAGNTTEGRGGGVFCGWNNRFYGNIANCVFTNNASRYQGGGLCIRENVAHPDDPATIRNCLFTNNRTTYSGDTSDTSDSNGGGVCLVTVNDVLMENCTIVSNGTSSSSYQSGGIHHRRGGKLKNCIVAFNTVGGEPEDPGSWSLQNSDTSYINCCGWPAVTHFTKSGSFSADPRFVDPANGDFTLVAASPCVAAGATAGWMADATDLAGNPRLTGGNVDIGCYEYGPRTFYVKTNGNDSNTGDSTGSAFKTLGKGFSVVNSKKGTTLKIVGGTYEIGSALSCTGGDTEDMRTVIANYNSTPVVINAKGATDAVLLSGNVTLSGVTIANGTNAGKDNFASGVRIGGPSDADGTLAVVTNCVITGCTNAYTSAKKIDGKSAYGAAAFVFNNGLLVDSVVSNNTAVYRGSAVALCGADATAKGCTIVGNIATNNAQCGFTVVGFDPAARDGTGALLNKSSGRLVDCFVGSNIVQQAGATRNVAYITNCTFQGNAALFSGGAVTYDGTILADSVTPDADQVRAVVADCTFADNAVDEDSAQGGGALRLSSHPATVSRCLFSGNSSPRGGAVDVLYASPATFEDCVFENNRSRFLGGAVRFAAPTSSDSFDHCGFFGNCTYYGGGYTNITEEAGTGVVKTNEVAQYSPGLGGGGVFIADQQAGSYVTVSNSVFGGNGTTGRGGAFAVTHESVFYGAIANCVFTNNASQFQGGAVNIRELTNHVENVASVRNCLFAYNCTTNGSSATDGSGGAFALVSSNAVEVANCTFVSNSAAYKHGGGLYQRWGGNIYNCVIANNTTDGSQEDDWTDGYGAFTNNCAWPNTRNHLSPENGNVNADPLFVDELGGDFRLSHASPCRNAGCNEAWMAGAVDLDGEPRKVGDVDIGCYEARQMTWFVKSEGGNDSNSGASWDEALATASKGFETINTKASELEYCELVFDSGTHALGEHRTCEAGGNIVEIRGRTGNPADVKLDAEGAKDAILLSGNVTLSGVTIANGTNTNGTNGVLFPNFASGVRIGDNPVADGTLAIVTNCVITGCTNAYPYGMSIGGVGAFGGPVVVFSNGMLVDSVVSNNAAVYRGSGVTLCGADATAKDCLIAGNIATNDYVNGSGMAVLAYNRAENIGGTLLRKAAGNLIGCTVQSNLAVRCGGAYNVANVTNCTFEGNWASHLGGAAFYCGRKNNESDDTGIECEDDLPLATIADCRFFGNSIPTNAPYGGGALRIDSYPLYVTNCVFSGNEACRGAAADAVYCANATFDDCEFTGNKSVHSGGAVRIAMTSSSNFFNVCRFFSNSTENKGQAESEGDTNPQVGVTQGGGAIFVSDMQTNSWFSVYGCEFAGNTTTGRGGAIGVKQGGVCYGSIENSVFTNNASQFQGGGVNIREEIAHTADTAFIRNCLFARNRTIYVLDDNKYDSAGGGLSLVTSNDVQVSNCTFVENVSGECGGNVGTRSGGVHQRWGGIYRNCIVASNLTNAGREPDTNWTDSRGAFYNCCAYPVITTHMTAANGCINEDPRFTGSEHGVFMIRKDSPCHDAGVNETWMDGAKDLAGMNRISGGTVDMGAYEVSAVDYYVKTGGSDSKNGTSWDNAFKTVMKGLKAIGNAPGGSVLHIGSGTYTPTSRLSFTGARLPGEEVKTIRGETGNPADVVIDAGGTTNVLRTAYGVCIADLTFRNGTNKDSDEPVGAIRLGIVGNRDPHEMSITNCIVEACTNARPMQAVVIVCGANSKVFDTVFRNNVSDYDGILKCYDFTTNLVSGCTFENNTAERGGGIFAPKTVLDCTNCVFKGNSAGWNGGGICVEGASQANVTDCRFEGNAVTKTASATAGLDNEKMEQRDNEYWWNVNCGGAGIFLHTATNADPKPLTDGYCNIRRCSFGGNTSKYLAGAIGSTFKTNMVAAMTVYGCVFTNNSAVVQGGAIEVLDAGANNVQDLASKYPVIIRNSLFANNATITSDGATESGARGGAIYAGFSNPGSVVDSCTIVTNTASFAGGGLFHLWGGTVTNCLIAFNTVNGPPDNNWWIGNAPAGTYAYNCIYPAPDGNTFNSENCILGVDPKLVDPVNGDFAFKPGSKCWNGGVNEAWMEGETDIAGNPRIFSRRADIGCHELQIYKGMTSVFR